MDHSSVAVLDRSSGCCNTPDFGLPPLVYSVGQFFDDELSFGALRFSADGVVVCGGLEGIVSNK